MPVSRLLIAVSVCATAGFKAWERPSKERRSVHTAGDVRRYLFDKTKIADIVTYLVYYFELALFGL